MHPHANTGVSLCDFVQSEKSILYVEEQKEGNYFGIEVTKDFKEKLRKLLDYQEFDPTLKELREKYPDQFTEENGYIFQKGKDNRNRIYVPLPLQNDIVEYYHNWYGHVGIAKTIIVIKRLFTWKWIKETVVTYVSRCRTCGIAKAHYVRPLGPNQQIEITRLNQFIFVDHFGPLPCDDEDEDRYLFVILEGYSKLVKLYPVPDTSVEHVVKCLNHYLQIYAEKEKVENVLSDNGACFTKPHYIEFLKERGICPCHTSPYSPHVNIAERIMGRVGDYLRVCMITFENPNHAKWMTYIPDIECAINETEHGATKQIPYEVMKGKKIPDEIPDLLGLPLMKVDREKILEVGLRLKGIENRASKGYDERS